MNNTFKPVVATCCCLLVAAIVWVDVHVFCNYMGFPDGFLTDLDRARPPVYAGFMVISLIVSLWLVYLGWLAAKPTTAIKLLIPMGAYWLMLTTLISVDDARSLCIL